MEAHTISSHEFNMKYQDNNCTYLQGTISTDIQQWDLVFYSAVDNEGMCITLHIFTFYVKTTQSTLFFSP